MIFFHRASSVKTLNPRTGMNISNIFNEKTVKFMIPVSKLKKLKISYEKKYKTTENNIENAVDIVKDFFDILYFLNKKIVNKYNKTTSTNNIMLDFNFIS